MKISREVRHDITLQVSGCPHVESRDGNFLPIRIQVSWWEQNTSPKPRAYVIVTGHSERRGSRAWPNSAKFNLHSTGARPCPDWLIRVVRQVGYTGWIEGSVQ